MSALEMASLMNREDAAVPRAVKRVLPQVAKAIEIIAQRLGRGGRLFYVGTGTSGRIGALDAVEIPPTFGIEPGTIQFVIAGGVCGLAGALLVNHTAYLTPEFMNWTRSGELMFMVILGGMGSVAGPVLGAFALLLLEDLLSGWTTHWQLYLGPLLVLSVLFFRRGLAGAIFPKNE